MIASPDLVFLFSWLALVLVLHFSLLPVFRGLSPGVCVPVSFSLSLLLFTLISFWLTWLHLPLFLSLLPFMLLFIGSLLWGAGSDGERGIRSLLRTMRSEWRTYALFFLVFFAMMAVRLYSPDINHAEKFMDHGFIASMMRTPVIPPLDPWFSGGDLSVYYYLGHWMLASLGLTAHVPSHYLFTIALPTIAALAAVNLYGAGHLLLTRFRLLPVLFLFLVNPAFLGLLVSQTPWNTLLWNSTRVIEGTINEYPLFSFIFGDVHAHVLDIFPQTLLILLITLALTRWTVLAPRSRLLLILSTALALGSVPPTNSWDILVQAPLIILTGLFLVLGSANPSPAGLSPVFSVPQTVARVAGSLLPDLKEPHRDGLLSPLRGAAAYLVLVPSLGILCYLPFYLAMKTQGVEGIGLVTTPSTLSSFFLVHGWFLVIFLISLAPVLSRAPWILIPGGILCVCGYWAAGIAMVLLLGVMIRREGAGDLFAGTGLVILIFCELLYLKDNMGDQYFRMNTVFKLSITAWLFFSMAAAAMSGSLLTRIFGQKPGTALAGDCLICLFLVALLVSPAIVTASQSGLHTPTLDGLAWLSVYHPDDLAAVTWLRGQAGPLTLAEAEDGDYHYYSRISSFTGIPAILGWPFHEMMWRQDYPPGWYGERTADLEAIYEDPLRSVSLMKKYGADLLYLGEPEEERYDVHLPATGLTPVFRHGTVTIYRVS